MSSLQKTPAGYRLQFRIDGKLRQLSLRGLTKRQAEQVQRNIDHLIASRTHNARLEEWCQKWIDGLSREFRRQLERMELAPTGTPSAPAVDLLDAWLVSRINLAQSTQHNDGQFRTSFFACFGNKLTDEFTAGDGDDFREFCLRVLKLAENTTRKRCGQGSAFFRYLMKRRLASINPFDDVPKAVGSAIRDKAEVSAEVIERVLKEAPNAEWRALIVLGRWGGLRIPSEAFAMTWNDINWQQNRFIVNSSKTAHQNKPQRTVPLFPELVPYLTELAETQPNKTERLFPVLSRKSGNVGAPFKKMIVRAGVKVWPKVWNSLRSTRETELAAVYPVHVVCEWMGNTTRVASRHYLKATETDFEAACKAPTPAPTVIAHNGDQTNTMAHKPVSE